MKTLDAKRVLETALICAGEPMSLRDIGILFAGELAPDTLRGLLDELGRDCEGRGIELVTLANGWRYQSRPEMREVMARLRPERAPKYSRAAMETLAIIAYRQPVTRGDIEDIRGVAVSSQIVKQLEDRGWIEAIGYREAAGRPALLATTGQFLNDLGLAGLDQLPALVADGTDREDGAAPALLIEQQSGLLFEALAAVPDGPATPATPGDAGLDGPETPPEGSPARGSAHDADAEMEHPSATDALIDLQQDHNHSHPA